MLVQFIDQLKGDDHVHLIAMSEKMHHSYFIKHLDKEYQTDFITTLKKLNFEGKRGQGQFITVNETIFVFFGIGKKDEINELALTEIGGECYGWLKENRIKKVVFHVNSFDLKSFDDYEVACHLALGMELRSYEFNQYKTKDEKKINVEECLLLLEQKKLAQKKWEITKTMSESVNLARDLITTPARDLYPETMADQCRELRSIGIYVEILDEEKIEALGMGALLGVSQGSARPPRVIVLNYRGGNKGDRPLAFIGKGVTFDSGGLSLKPPAGMEQMKYDMAGSATVVGLMHQLASRKANVNAVGVIGMVENMPDGNAQKPGDVVTSMSGQTIEVLNTDAEGRLVLADLLWYTQDRFKPKFMINLATLTGAIVIALGSQFAGLFSNDDNLSNQLLSAGEITGEKLWRLPLTKQFDELINSPIADMMNISKGREAGSITAAQFLQRFVNNIPWAHVDIAGVAFTDKDSAITPKGACGYGIRLLNQFIIDNYEN